jgi:hypothetical protein
LVAAVFLRHDFCDEPRQHIGARRNDEEEYRGGSSKINASPRKSQFNGTPVCGVAKLIKATRVRFNKVDSVRLKSYAE